MWTCPNCSTVNWDSAAACYSCGPEARARREAILQADAEAGKAAEEQARLKAIVQAQKDQELKARLQATAARRQALDQRMKAANKAAQDDKPQESAKPTEPEDEPIPKNADWDDSLNDLDSDYWEWYFDRKHSQSSTTNETKDD
jgi:hypothetical protein